MAVTSTRGEVFAAGSALGLHETLIDEAQFGVQSNDPIVWTGAGNVETATAQTTVTSITINKPANTAVGDLLVAWIASQNNSNTTPPTSSGWARVGPAYNVTGDTGRRPSGMFVLKVTDSTVLAGLPSSWTWSGPTGAGRWGGGIVRVTGVDLTSDPTTWASGAYNTDSTLASPSRVLSGATAPSSGLLFAGVSAQMNAVATPTSVSWSDGLLEAFDICTSASGTVTHQTMSLAYQSVSTGATGTRTATFPSNPASASGYVVTVPAVAAPATPTATTVRVIAHRGTLDSAADNTENSVAGLDILAALRRPVSGIEWDVRVSSDGELFLMHDATGARTHPAMGATGVEGYTASQLDTFGVTRLTTGLAACAGRGFERINLQHYFPGSNTAALNKLLTQIAASPVGHRVKIMTSISGPYAPVQIRAAGWTGPIGTYGSTAANYAGSGDGKAADFPASTIGWAYLPPGGYTANRAHVTTLQGAGILVGASTENSSTQWAEAHSDGISEMLTDNSDSWLALYEPPPAVYDLAVTAAGSTTTDGSAALRVTSSLTGSGSVTTDGTAGITTTARLTGSGTTTTGGSAAVTARLAMSGSATTTLDGSAALRTTQALTGAGSATADGAATLRVRHSLTGAGATVVDGSAGITARLQVTATGTTTTSGGAGLDIDGPGPSVLAVTASGATATDGAAGITRRTTLTGAGTAATDGTAALTRRASLTATGTTTTSGSAAFSGAFTLTASAVGSFTGAAQLTAIVVLAAAGQTTSSGSASLTQGGLTILTPSSRTFPARFGVRTFPATFTEVLV